MLSLIALLAAPAQAAPCDARTETLQPEQVAAAWSALASCDRQAAASNFKAYVAKAGNTEAMAALLVAAARSESPDPAWGALEYVKDYETRAEVARTVGAACATEPKVVEFLRGAHARKPTVFAQWADAWATCESEALWTFAAEQVATPPASSFDEKYDMLLGVYVRQQRAKALPSLAAAAIRSAGGKGPFENLVNKMGEAATPGVGEAPSAEAKSAYTAALADVAKKVKGEDVARVAAALAANGADGEAAKLLPAVYPDRAQKGGSFLYGAVAVEAGTCGGKKSAVVHTVSVSEPGKRWSIDADLEAALASVKPKLDKSCTAEPLVVLHTPGPVKSAEEVEAFQEGVVKKWEGNGFAVKTQKEKALTLP